MTLIETTCYSPEDAEVEFVIDACRELLRLAEFHGLALIGAHGALRDALEDCIADATRTPDDWETITLAGKVVAYEKPLRGESTLHPQFGIESAYETLSPWRKSFVDGVVEQLETTADAQAETLHCRNTDMRNAIASCLSKQGGGERRSRPVRIGGPCRCALRQVRSAVGPTPSIKR